MTIFLTIIAVVVIFSVLVLIHELGHFVAARRGGVKVLEFGLGYPPRIFGKKYGETTYSINAIPFGGFCRMLGEDTGEPGIIKNKRSFASKDIWIRTKIIVAGVLMNFLLAIFLLTVGFSFGIEPLLVNEQDLFTNLAAGNITASPGAFVGKIADKAQNLGLTEGDQIIAINDKQVALSGQLDVFEKGKAQKDMDLTVVKAKTKELKKIHIPLVGKDSTYGISLKTFTEFPRLSVLEVKPGSNTFKAGIHPQDIILKINGKEIYFQEDMDAALAQSAVADFVVLRGNHMVDIKVTLPDARKVVIADIFDGSAAVSAGFQKHDVILAIDGAAISDPIQIQQILKKTPGKEMEYKLSRDGKDVLIKTKSGNGNVLGVALSSIFSYKNSELSVYRDSIITSITEIKKVRYGVWPAFKNAVYESFRLTGLTVAAFGRTLGSLVSKLAVPAEIGGPVQIAYYTHTFVQEGFFALLRFTALLSLSLAVINILPIPGLDGGRLLFIILEAVTRRRVNARLEGLIHSLGFLLLIGLIVLVTYSDIVKLF